MGARLRVVHSQLVHFIVMQWGDGECASSTFKNLQLRVLLSFF